MIPNKIQAISSGYKFRFVGVEAQGVQLAKGELLKLTGPAIFLDRISGNGRKYIEESVHQQVRELEPRIAAKALLGESDHPPITDLTRLAYVSLKEASHRIDRLWYVPAERAYYIELTILDTINGRNMKAIYDAGSPLFVSLRSLLDPNRGIQKQGYTEAWMMALITIDFVSRPGFADAVLTPVAASNEAMMAVCESLNIEGFVKKQNNSKNNIKMKQKTTMYAIESIVQSPMEVSTDFQNAVNNVILKIIEDFPVPFLQEDFNAKYNGVIETSTVGLFGDTAEIKVEPVGFENEHAFAVIQLTKDDATNEYTITKDSEVTYSSNDDATFQVIEENQEGAAGTEAKTSKKSKGMYAIVATENYAPTDVFATTMNSIVNALMMEYPQGFTAADNNTVLSIIDNASSSQGFTATIEGDVIKVIDATNENGATINLAKSDDDEEPTFTIDGIAEYFSPTGSGEQPAEQADPATEAIMEAAKKRWEAGGKERYAKLQAGLENEDQAAVIINEDGTINDANDVQAFKIIDEDDKGEQDKANVAKASVYEIVETGDADGNIQQTYAVLDKNGEPLNDDAPAVPANADPGTIEEQQNEDLNANELAVEAARVFGMPNNKYAGNFAIEHMPIGYKHLWNGLSAQAKAIFAKQSEHVATEAQTLQFFQKTNFIALEQLALDVKGTNVTAGVEALLASIKPNDTTVSNIFGQALPSRNWKK